MGCVLDALQQSEAPRRVFGCIDYANVQLVSHTLTRLCRCEQEAARASEFRRTDLVPVDLLKSSSLVLAEAMAQEREKHVHCTTKLPREGKGLLNTVRRRTNRTKQAGRPPRASSSSALHRFAPARPPPRSSSSLNLVGPRRPFSSRETRRRRRLRSGPPRPR